MEIQDAGALVVPFMETSENQRRKPVNALKMTNYNRYTHILLSVKPPHSGDILDGSKLLELRKTLPKSLDGGSLMFWIYESTKKGAQAIIGRFCVPGWKYLSMSYHGADSLLEEVAEKACVPVTHVINYLPCYAIHVTNAVPINPIPLSAIGLSRPPQSWQYLNDKQEYELRHAQTFPEAR